MVGVSFGPSSSDTGWDALNLWCSTRVFESCLHSCSWFQLPADVYPGKAVVMVHAFGFLSPTRETWIEFPALCFSLSLSWLLWAFGKWTKRLEALSIFHFMLLCKVGLIIFNEGQSVAWEIVEVLYQYCRKTGRSCDFQNWKLKFALRLDSERKGNFNF